MTGEPDALIAAAEANDPNALAPLAYVRALGYCQPRAVDEALDLLARSAALGWNPAQRELRFLARGEGSDWRALRARIDVAALRMPPPKHAISESPRLRVFPAFATPAECDWLIERGRAELKPTQVYQSDMVPREGQRRTNSDFVLTTCDLVVCLI